MSTNGLNILLIDDSEFIVQRLQQLLLELQYVKDVQCAYSAEQGTLVLKNYTPDIIILDINLPGKNGLQMLKEIRQMENIYPVIIILTNNTLSGYKAECMQYGADHFLDKARDFETIPVIIEQTTRKSLNT